MSRLSGDERVSFRRPFRIALGGVAVVAALLWSGVHRLERAIVGERCGPLPAAELTMAELGSLREKVSAYRADASKPLVLEPAELSWALTEQYHTPVWLLAVDGGVDAIRPVRLTEGACADLEFHGDLWVRSGRIVARPQRVRFAGWNLPLPPGMTYELEPTDLGIDDPALLELLDATERVRVVDGRFEVELRDPSVLP